MLSDFPNLLQTGISSITLLCFMYTMYILNARNKHQEKTISDLKTLLEIIDINKIKAIQEWQDVALKRHVNGVIEDFKLSQEKRIKDLGIPSIKKIVKQMDETIEGNRLYGHEWVTELVPLTFPLVLSEPKEERQKFIEETFPLSKDLLIDFFIKQGEI